MISKSTLTEDPLGRERGRTSVLGRAAAVALVAAVACVVSGVSTSEAAPPFGCNLDGGTVTCQYTSRAAEQTLVIPKDVTTVHVEATGAPGGTSELGTATGGTGGTVSGDLPVTTNEVLYIEVGGSGGRGANGTGGSAGWNGGGAGGSFHGGGGGGGASDVRTVGCSTSCTADTSSLASRLLVAGGGGGDAGNSAPGSGDGGNAGSAGGQGFYASAPTGGAHGGGAGTAGSGGAGGPPNCGGVLPPNGEPGDDGALALGGDGGTGFPLNGGVGNNAAAAGGGGGGGGYYGGGGGASAGNQASCGAAGGGGGSNYLDTTVSNGQSGVASSGSPARVTITFAAPASLGRTYFVAPGGTAAGPCNENSQSNPYAQIRYALNCAGDGDVVSVAPSATPYAGLGPVYYDVTIEATYPHTAREVRVDLSQPDDVAGTVTVEAGATVEIDGLTLDCADHNCAKPNIINHGTLSLLGDTITGAGGEVAVLSQSNGSSAASLYVVGSTIAHNVNSGLGGTISQGGGIEVTGSPTPTAGIANSTIADNAAEMGGYTTGSGGGIYAAAGSSVSVLSSTITGNSANGSSATGGGIYVADGATSGTVVLANAILDGNTAQNGAADCQGAASSGIAGHNVVGDSRGCGQLFSVYGNQLGVNDPGLGTLGDHGGPTDTVPLLDTSPAIASGAVDACTDSHVGGVDQRGAPRNAGTRGTCDSGAYDTGGDTTPPAITITAPGDGAHYPQGATLAAGYSCSDPNGSGDVETCEGRQAGSKVAKGGTLDTSTAGDHSFTVHTTDWDGNAATTTVTYTVDAPAPPSGGGGSGPGGTSSPPPGGTTPKPGSGSSPRVDASADLTLSGRLSKRQLRQGHRGVYTLRARNLGPGTATEVVLTANLPRQLRIVSVRKVHGGRCSRHGRKVTCRFGSVATGKTLHVSLVVKAVRRGHGHVVVSGRAHERDPHARNNKRSTKTVVLRRAGVRTHGRNLRRN